MKRSVFFETLHPWDWPWVAWALSRGDRIFVFDFSRRLKRIGWARRWIHRGRIERIYIHPGSRAEGLALDAAEEIFPIFIRHPLFRSIAHGVGTRESESPFKYSLVQSLVRYFFVRLFLSQWRSATGGSEEIRLFSESFRHWHRRLDPWCRRRLEPQADLRIRLAASWPSGMGRLLLFFREYGLRYAACGLTLGAIHLARLVRGFLAQHGETSPVRYRLAYSIATSFQAKSSGWRRFSFLLDQEALTRQNTVLMAMDAGEGPWVEQVRREGYAVLRRGEISSLRGIWRNPPRDVPWARALQGIFMGLCSPLAPGWLHEAAVVGWGVLLRETNFYERVRFDHYVYTNQYGLLPRWRNVLVRRVGGQSWWFAYSSMGGFLFRSDEPFAGGNDLGDVCRFWAYENADHFVSPSAQLIQYYRRHRQTIRCAHDVGNLWSELIAQAQQELDLQEIHRGWFGDGQGKGKVIAWFDTSFAEAPNSPATFREAIRWYEDILRLAQEREDLWMVIKPSKAPAYYVGEGSDQQWSDPTLGRELIRVWKLLQQHPRVRFLEHGEDPTPVVAASDLTVTYCFSAVSAEALGARRRAIWYEPGQRWRDTLYGKQPWLVAHGYEELKGLVQKLLFETSEPAYQDFLDGVARGLVESHLDGKGLTRFRRLLVSQPLEEIPRAIEAPAGMPVR